MKIALIFLILMNIAEANEVKKKILAYTAQIEETQKQIAAAVVLQNFSRLYVETVGVEDLENQLEYYLGQDNSKGLSKISTDFFDVIYSEQVDDYKINSVTKLLLQLRRSKHLWIMSGARVRKASEKFLLNFNTTEDICSDQNFADSLTVLQTFSPEGVDTSKLASAWELSAGGNVTIADNYTGVGGQIGSNGPGSDDDIQNMRRAVLVTTGVALAPVLTPLGSAAVALAIEFTWAAIDLQKKINSLEKVAKANKELYETMSFEVNVKKHFKSYCEGLSRAYTESGPLIRTIQTSGGKDQVKAAMETARSNLPKEGGDIFKSAEDFYKYAKFNILNEALLVFSSDEQYSEHLRHVLDRMDHMSSVMERGLSQIIAHKTNQQYAGNYELLTQLLSQVETFNNFKSTFYSSLLSYFDSDQVQRLQKIKEMKLLIENYTFYKHSMTAEENEAIRVFLEVISRLEVQHA